MKQREAVVETLEQLWWVATLWQINHHIFTIKECSWATLTPFASIRRIVQKTPKEIYKIKPWLYWLVKYKKINEDKWIIEISEKNKNSKDIQELNHYYYQWLLVEIGNLEKYETYVPNQDQNRLFLNQKLKELISIQEMYKFWYDELMRRARTIDVIWFNDRKMPNHFFEVEHSTDIQNSLWKFSDLQDYNAHFTIVAHEIRKKEYSVKKEQTWFKSIKERVKFLTYEELANYHTKTYEYCIMKDKLTIYT